MSNTLQDGELLQFLRTADGLERQPLCVPKAHGGFYRPPTGPGVINPFSLGPLRYRHKVGTQGVITVSSSSTPVQRAKLFPFVDDFVMFEEIYDKTLALATTVFALLASLEIKVHPTKGHFLPILVVNHLGMTLDFENGEF